MARPIEASLPGGDAEIYAQPGDVIERATALIEEAAARGPVALSGGATPRPVYEAVAAHGVSGAWYQVDERCVPYDDPASNAAMIERAGLTLHRIRTDLPPDDAAAAYESELRDSFALTPPALAVMGIGEDGHTASLFPGAPEIDEVERWVVATDGAHAGHRRVTITLPLLARFERRVFIVTGAGKADTVRRVLVDREPLPATRVPASLWLLDAGAAREIRARPAG